MNLLTLESSDLLPLIDAIAAAVVAKLGVQHPGPRLAYPEAEAAKMLGVKPHVLRDLRRRGMVRHVQLDTGRILYTTEQLTAMLDAKKQ